MKNALTLVVVVAFLAGCNKSPEPVQTVDWYKENKTEREAMRKRCHNNPGQLAADPNCINADKAQSAVDGAKRGGLSFDRPAKIDLRGGK